MQRAKNGREFIKEAIYEEVLVTEDYRCSKEAYLKSIIHL